MAHLSGLVVATDLCGTTHDAKQPNYETILDFARSYGRAMPSYEAIFRAWTGDGWIAFLERIGFSRDEAIEVHAGFSERFIAHEPSPIIDGAYALFSEFAPHPVTGASINVVERRFFAHGLEAHLARVHAGVERKGPILARVARGRPIVYLGDTLADGWSVTELQRSGAPAHFIGLTHPESFMPEEMRAFCARNAAYASEAASLTAAIEKIRELQERYSRPAPR